MPKLPCNAVLDTIKPLEKVDSSPTDIPQVSITNSLGARWQSIQKSMFCIDEKGTNVLCTEYYRTSTRDQQIGVSWKNNEKLVWSKWFASLPLAKNLLFIKYRASLCI